jgi:hypothetical protein
MGRRGMVYVCTGGLHGYSGGGCWLVYNIHPCFLTTFSGKNPYHLCADTRIPCPPCILSYCALPCSRWLQAGGAEDWAVRCRCGTTDDDGERMVACEGCALWMHTRCNGLPDWEEELPPFMCADCMKGLRGAARATAGAGLPPLGYGRAGGGSGSRQGSGKASASKAAAAAAAAAWEATPPCPRNSSRLADKAAAGCGPPSASVLLAGGSGGLSGHHGHASEGRPGSAGRVSARLAAAAAASSGM